jgi:hypothetical protein
MIYTFGFSSFARSINAQLHETARRNSLLGAIFHNSKSFLFPSSSPENEEKAEL